MSYARVHDILPNNLVNMVAYTHHLHLFVYVSCNMLEDFPVPKSCQASHIVLFLLLDINICPIFICNKDEIQLITTICGNQLIISLYNIYWCITFFFHIILIIFRKSQIYDPDEFDNTLTSAPVISLYQLFQILSALSFNFVNSVFFLSLAYCLLPSEPETCQ